MMKDQQLQCQESSTLMDETKGRMVILDQENPTAEGKGFHRSLCVTIICNLDHFGRMLGNRTLRRYHRQVPPL